MPIEKFAQSPLKTDSKTNISPIVLFGGSFIEVAYFLNFTIFAIYFFARNLVTKK